MLVREDKMALNGKLPFPSPILIHQMLSKAERTTAVILKAGGKDIRRVVQIRMDSPKVDRPLADLPAADLPVADLLVPAHQMVLPVSAHLDSDPAVPRSVDIQAAVSMAATLVFNTDPQGQDARFMFVNTDKNSISETDVLL